MNTSIIAAQMQAKTEHQTESTSKVSSYDAYIMAMYYAMQGNQSSMAQEANAMQVKENRLETINEEQKQIQNATADSNVAAAIIGANRMGNQASMLTGEISRNGGFMQADSMVNRTDANQGVAIIRSFARIARVRV